MDESRVHVLTHPVAQSLLTILREASTKPCRFRNALHKLTWLLAFQVTRNTNLLHTTVKTPLGEATGYTLAEKPALVPILRAGLGMLDPFQQLLPESPVWPVGAQR